MGAKKLLSRTRNATEPSARWHETRREIWCGHLIVAESIEARSAEKANCESKFQNEVRANLRPANLVIRNRTILPFLLPEICDGGPALNEGLPIGDSVAKTIT